MRFEEWIDELKAILADSGLDVREEWAEAAREGWRAAQGQKHGRCATCKSWRRVRSVREDAGGECLNEKLREKWGDASHEPDALVYSYSEGGGFWTGPDFGCVHHKSVSDPPT